MNPIGSSPNTAVIHVDSTETSHPKDVHAQKDISSTLSPRRPGSPQLRDFPLRHMEVPPVDIVETIPPDLNVENICWDKFVERKMTMVSVKALLEFAQKLSPDDFANVGFKKKDSRPDTPSNLHAVFDKASPDDKNDKALLMCLSSVGKVLTTLRSEIKKMAEKQPDMPSAVRKRTFAAAHLEIFLHEKKILDVYRKTLSGGRLDASNKKDYAPTVTSKDTELRPRVTYRVDKEDVAMAYGYFPAGMKLEELTRVFDKHCRDAKRFFLQNKGQLKVLLKGEDGSLDKLFQKDIDNQASQENCQGNVTVCFRVQDAEFKLLTQALTELDELCGKESCSRDDLHGVMEIFAEREFCISCQNVLKQFSEKFPNLKLLLLSGGRKIRVDATESVLAVDQKDNAAE